MTNHALCFSVRDDSHAVLNYITRFSRCVSAHPAYYYRCSPNTTMNSLLVFIANAIGVRVVGDNGTVQDRIQRKLQDDPNYCFVFDEAEYLAIYVSDPPFG